MPQTPSMNAKHPLPALDDCIPTTLHVLMNSNILQASPNGQRLLLGRQNVLNRHAFFLARMVKYVFDVPTNTITALEVNDGTRGFQWHGCKITDHPLSTAQIYNGALVRVYVTLVPGTTISSKYNFKFCGVEALPEYNTAETLIHPQSNQWFQIFCRHLAFCADYYKKHSIYGLPRHFDDVNNPYHLHKISLADYRMRLDVVPAVGKVMFDQRIDMTGRLLCLTGVLTQKNPRCCYHKDAEGKIIDRDPCEATPPGHCAKADGDDCCFLTIQDGTSEFSNSSFCHMINAMADGKLTIQAIEASKSKKVLEKEQLLAEQKKAKADKIAKKLQSGHIPTLTAQEKKDAVYDYYKTIECKEDATTSELFTNIDIYKSAENFTKINFPPCNSLQANQTISLIVLLNPDPATEGDKAFGVYSSTVWSNEPDLALISTALAWTHKQYPNYFESDSLPRVYDDTIDTHGLRRAGVNPDVVAAYMEAKEKADALLKEQKQKQLLSASSHAGPTNKTTTEQSQQQQQQNKIAQQLQQLPHVIPMSMNTALYHSERWLCDKSGLLKDELCYYWTNSERTRVVAENLAKSLADAARAEAEKNGDTTKDDKVKKENDEEVEDASAQMDENRRKVLSLPADKLYYKYKLNGVPLEKHYFSTLIYLTHVKLKTSTKGGRKYLTFRITDGSYDTHLSWHVEYIFAMLNLFAKQSTAALFVGKTEQEIDDLMVEAVLKVWKPGQAFKLVYFPTPRYIEGSTVVQFSTVYMQHIPPQDLHQFLQPVPQISHQTATTAVADAERSDASSTQLAALGSDTTTAILPTDLSLLDKDPFLQSRVVQGVLLAQLKFGNFYYKKYFVLPPPQQEQKEDKQQQQEKDAKILFHNNIMPWDSPYFIFPINNRELYDTTYPALDYAPATYDINDLPKTKKNDDDEEDDNKNKKTNKKLLKKSTTTNNKLIPDGRLMTNEERHAYYVNTLRDQAIENGRTKPDILIYGNYATPDRRLLSMVEYTYSFPASAYLGKLCETCQKEKDEDAALPPGENKHHPLRYRPAPVDAKWCATCKYLRFTDGTATWVNSRGETLPLCASIAEPYADGYVAAPLNSICMEISNLNCGGFDRLDIDYELNIFENVESFDPDEEEDEDEDEDAEEEDGKEKKDGGDDAQKEKKAKVAEKKLTEEEKQAKVAKIEKQKQRALHHPFNDPIYGHISWDSPHIVLLSEKKEDALLQQHWDEIDYIKSLINASLRQDTPRFTLPKPRDNDYFKECFEPAEKK